VVALCWPGHGAAAGARRRCPGRGTPCRAAAPRRRVRPRGASPASRSPWSRMAGWCSSRRRPARPRLRREVSGGPCSRWDRRPRASPRPRSGCCGRGAVKLDQPVRPTCRVRAHRRLRGRHLTVRDLLAHRSGIERNDASGTVRARPPAAHGAPALPAAGLACATLQYNNLMYMVAGLIVERVTADLGGVRPAADPGAARHVRTSFGVPPVGDRDVAQPHASTARRRDHRAPLRRLGGRSALSICSTAEDMARWLQLLQVGACSTAGACSPRRRSTRCSPADGDLGRSAAGAAISSYGSGGSSRATAAADGVARRLDRRLLLRSSSCCDRRARSWCSPTPRSTGSRGGLALGRRPLLGLPEIDWNARLSAQQERLREQRQSAEAARDAQRRTGTAPVCRSPRSPPLPAPGLRRHAGLPTATRPGRHLPRMTGPLEHFQDDVFLFKVEGWGLREEFVVRFQYASDGTVSSLVSTCRTACHRRSSSASAAASLRRPPEGLPAD